MSATALFIFTIPRSFIAMVTMVTSSSPSNVLKVRKRAKTWENAAAKEQR